MKEIKSNFSLIYNDTRLFILRPIQTVLIFCDQVPISEPADFEVSSACPKSYPDKLTMCVFKP